MIYIPANENLCATIIGRPVTYTPGRSFTGAHDDAVSRAGADHIGEVQAWKSTPASACGRTHSDIRELGADAGDRRRAGLQRRHQRSHVPCVRRVDRQAAVGVPDQLRHHGQPSSFMVDGKQYVAVQSGWGIDSRAMQARLNRLLPGNIRTCPKAARCGFSR